MTRDNDNSDKTRPSPEAQGDGQPGSDQQGLSPDQRREALRKILAGGGIVVGAQSLPGNWTKPLIDSVVLPAHAVTTADGSTSGTPGTSTSSTPTTSTSTPPFTSTTTTGF